MEIRGESALAGTPIGQSVLVLFRGVRVVSCVHATLRGRMREVFLNASRLDGKICSGVYVRLDSLVKLRQSDWALRVAILIGAI